MPRIIALALFVLLAATVDAAQFEAQISGAVFDADSKGSPAIEGVTLDAAPMLGWRYREGESYRTGKLDAKIEGNARSGAGGTFVLKLSVSLDETKLPKPMAELDLTAILRGSKEGKLGVISVGVYAGVKATVLFPVFTSVRVSGKAVSDDGKTPLSGAVTFEAYGVRDLYSAKLAADGTFKVPVCPGLRYTLRVGEMVVSHLLDRYAQALTPITDTDLGPVRFVRPGTLTIDFEGFDLGRHGYQNFLVRHDAGFEWTILVTKDQLKHECILPPGTASVFCTPPEFVSPVEIRRGIVSGEVQTLHVMSELPRDVVLTGVELGYYQGYEITLSTASGEKIKAMQKNVSGRSTLVFPGVPAAAGTCTVAGTIDGYLPFSFEVELKRETTEIKLALVQAPNLIVEVVYRDGSSALAEVYVAPKGHEFELVFTEKGLDAALEWLYENRAKARESSVVTGYAQEKISLPAGEYFVLSSVFSSEANAKVPLFAYVTVVESGENKVELREPRSKATLILSRNGSPLSNSKVALSQWQSGVALEVHSGETDANGQWEIQGLYPGTYAVTLAAERVNMWDAWFSEIESRQFEHGHADGEYKLDLTYRHLCELTLTLELPSDIRLEATLRSTATDAYGRAEVFKRLEFAGANTLEPMLLPAGDYTFDASQRVSYDAFWPLFSETFSLTAGTQALKLAPKLRSISGRVELGGLKGVKEAAVSLIAWEEFGENYTRELTFGAEVKPDGSFMLMTVPVAEFTIQATVELEDGTTALAFMDGNGHDGPFTATLKPEVRKGRLVVSFESPQTYDVVVLQYRAPGGTWARPGLDARLSVSRKHEAVHLDGLPLGDIELRGIGLGCELPITKVKVEATAKLVSMKATATETIWFAAQDMPGGVGGKGTVIELLDKQGKVLLRDTHRFNSNWSTMRDDGDPEEGYFSFSVKLLVTGAASVRITFPGCNPVTVAVAPQPEDEYGELTPHYIEVTKK